MSNPYLIKGPASINFSGGRTSAYMTVKIQEAGSLNDPSVEVIFADTGKEREETYTFIEECSAHFGFKVVYVAYGYEPSDRRLHFDEGKTPFELMVIKEGYLPNPVTRICTDRLKIKQIHKYMLSKYGREYRKVIGFRADEFRRISNFRNAPDAHRILTPLSTAGATKGVVLNYFKTTPFDLRLKDWEGNCDLCFLKGAKKRKAVMRDRPELADWWIRIERERAATFRAHSPNYLTLLKQSVEEAKQLLFNFDATPDECEIDDLSDCFCTD